MIFPPAYKPDPIYLYRNAADWQETLQNIITYGQQGLGYGQAGLDVITGEPIVQGEFGDGAGEFEVTHGYDRDETKIIGIPKPYFYGGLGLIVIIGLAIGATIYNKSKKKK